MCVVTWVLTIRTHSHTHTHTLRHSAPFHTQLALSISQLAQQLFRYDKHYTLSHNNSTPPDTVRFTIVLRHFVSTPPREVNHVQHTYANSSHSIDAKNLHARLHTRQPYRSIKTLILLYTNHTQSLSFSYTNAPTNHNLTITTTISYAFK